MDAMKALRVNDAFNRLGIGRSTGYNHIKAGLFPMPFGTSANARVVLEDEINSLLRARAAGAGDDEIRQLVSNLHEARKSAGAAA